MGNMFGTTIQPQPPVSWFNQIYNPANPQVQGQQLGSAIWNTAFNPASIKAGYPTFQGLPGYTGQINPNINPNLTNSWSNWQPWNEGNEFVASWLGGGSGQPGQLAGSMPSQPGQIAPWAQSARSNVLQYGGVGGFPTQAMSSIAQYGAPSQIGQPMSSIAQGWGVPSNYLRPFLNTTPYRAQWG